TPAGIASVIAKGANDVAEDSAGNLYFTSAFNLQRLSVAGQLSRIPESPSHFRGDGGDATDALLYQPSDVKAHVSGALMVADTANQRVRRISAAGIISTAAADLNGPRGLATDRTGNTYIADTGNHRIRRLTPDARLEPFAGTGVAGFNGDVRLLG